jgi:hypothetical protein
MLQPQIANYVTFKIRVAKDSREREFKGVGLSALDAIARNLIGQYIKFIK